MRRSVEIQPCSIRFVIHRKFILPLGSFFSLSTNAGRSLGRPAAAFGRALSLRSRWSHFIPHRAHWPINHYGDPCLTGGGPLFYVRGFQLVPTTHGDPRLPGGGPLFCVRASQGGGPGFKSQNPGSNPGFVSQSFSALTFQPVGPERTAAFIRCTSPVAPIGPDSSLNSN